MFESYDDDETRVDPPKFRATHYSYIAGPEGIREPVDVLDFRDLAIETRRFVIHWQMEQGRCVAQIPFAESNLFVVHDVDSLRHVLKMVDDGRR